jgi:hypothetical protein
LRDGKDGTKTGKFGDAVLKKALGRQACSFLANFILNRQIHIYGVKPQDRAFYYGKEHAAVLWKEPLGLSPQAGTVEQRNVSLGFHLSSSSYISFRNKVKIQQV